MPKVTPKAVPIGRTFLRQWREFNKLSQESVAKEIGIDRSHLSKLERGKAPYNQGFLEAAAQLYKCSVTDLLVRDPTKDVPLWSMMEELSRADKAVRETAADVLRVLLKK